MPVYTSTFDDDVTTGWRVATLATAPNGERFLGEFGNGGTTLTLSQLPQHNRVTVSFDLYILRS